MSDERAWENGWENVPERREMGVRTRRAPGLGWGILAVVAAAVVASPVSGSAQSGVEAELRDRVEREGVPAAVEWYESLFEEGEEAAAPGGGADAVVALARELLAAGRGEDLLVVGHLAQSVHPEDVRLHYLHSEAHRLVGELREAIQGYQAALEVEEHAPSRARLEEFWGGAEPRPLGELLVETEATEGYLAARDRFFELKRVFDQTGAHDFSPSGVLAEARRLFDAGRTDDARLVAGLNAAVNRYTTESYLLAGEIDLVAGEAEAAAFPFRGATEVHRILEERGDGLVKWMHELHERQGPPAPEDVEIELNHARAHALRGEAALAREVYVRILESVPDHPAALEGLLLLGGTPPSRR